MGRCLTTTLALAKGRRPDPGAHALADQAIAFRRICEAMPEYLRPWVARAWNRYHISLLPRHTRWGRVRGPIGATVASLLDGGWSPVAPLSWIHPNREQYLDAADPDCGDQDIRKALVDTEQARLWAGAEGHHHARGIAAGPDLFGARAALTAILRRFGPGHHGAAHCVLAGGTWSQQRLFDCNLASSPECPRCREGPESDFHRFWQCAANSAISDEPVRTTHALSLQAFAGSERNQLLWLRGMATREPEGFPSDEDRPDREWSWAPQSLVQVPPGQLYSASDGSGGRHTSDPRLRRASSAAVLLAKLDGPALPPEAGHLAVVQACAASVPGAQSSARAEIYACTLAVRMLAARPGLGPDAVVTHYTDYALLVTNGTLLLAGGPVNREWPNADLYRGLARELGTLPCRLRICKVKAHIDASPSALADVSGTGRPVARPAGPEANLDVLCPIGVFGNVVCDNIATYIATRIEPPEATVVALQLGDRLTYQILARLVHINIACAASDRPDLLPRKGVAAKTPTARREAFGRTL